MKLVKYYAWERFFEKEISDARAKEKHLMFWNAVIKTINVGDARIFGCDEFSEQSCLRELQASPF
jgi:hypothetical protein